MNNNPQEISNLSQELFCRKFNNLLCDIFSDKICHVPQPIQTKYKPSHYKLAFHNFRFIQGFFVEK